MKRTLSVLSALTLAIIYCGYFPAETLQAAPSVSVTDTETDPPGDDSALFTNHGIAADIAAERPRRNTIRTTNADGDPVLVPFVASIRGSSGVIVINLETGDYEQIHMPDVRENWQQTRTTLLASNNRIYTLIDEYFLEFDIDRREWTVVEEAVGSPVLGRALREAPDGRIWAATHGHTMDLNVLDPETGEVTQYPGVHAENWLQYPGKIAFDDQGWLYISVGRATPRLIAFHPETEQKQLLLEEDAFEAGQGAPELRVGIDFKPYARMPDGNWHRLAGGDVQQIADNELPEERILRDYGELPSRWTFRYLNMPEGYVRVMQQNGFPQFIDFSYESEGARIHSVATGPDGRVYGSTGHPSSIWAYDPAADEFELHTDAFGRWGALTTYEDRIFGGNYPRGILWEYDPAQPWTYRFRLGQGDTNPRFIMEGAEEMWRARAIRAHPEAGYVLLGGNPFTGITGGGLVLFNVNSDEYTLLPDAEAVRDQSTLAIAALPDGTFLGGTTISPGIGGEQRAEEAVLYVLDPEQGRIVWEETPTPGIHTVRDMITGPDGLVYGIYNLDGNSHLFVFDPQTRQMIHEENVEPLYGRATGDQDPRTLIVGPDDNIYGLFADAIVRIHTVGQEVRHEKLATPPVYPRTGIAVLGNRIYFAEMSELWSFRIPDLD